jgi:hypothetical protein
MTEKGLTVRLLVQQPIEISGEIFFIFFLTIMPLILSSPSAKKYDVTEEQ